MKRLLPILFFLILTSCSDNYEARFLGGNAAIDLPAGKRLVTIAWKGADIWYLVRDSTGPDDRPQTYQFSESSQFGILNGSYVVREH